MSEKRPQASFSNGLGSRNKMHNQSHSYQQRGTGSKEHGRGGAILDESNAGVSFRMQVIDQMLEGGIEQFRCHDQAAGQQHERPPERLEPQHDEGDQDSCEGRYLQPEARFAAPGCGQSGESEAQSTDEWLVFVDCHRRQL